MGKTKLSINCFRNPTSTYICHEKLKNMQLREATNGWLPSWTHPAFRCQTQCLGKVIPQSNLNRQQTPCQLRRSTPWYSKLQWISYCRSSSMSNSSRSRWWKIAEQKEFELTLYVQHTMPSNITSRYNDKKLWSRQSLAIVYTGRSRCWSRHSAAAPTQKNKTERFGE